MQWVGGPQIGVQSNMTRDQRHMLASTAVRGSLHQGTWAGHRCRHLELSLQHPPLCSSKVVQGLDLSWAGKGLLKPIMVFRLLHLCQFLVKNSKVGTVHGIPLCRDWSRVGLQVSLMFHKGSYTEHCWVENVLDFRGGREEGGLSSLEYCCAHLGPRAAAAILASAPRVMSLPKKQGNWVRASGLGRSRSPPFLVTSSHAMQSFPCCLSCFSLGVCHLQLKAQGGGSLRAWGTMSGTGASNF